MNAVVAVSPAVLSDDLIQACGERAALYDRENRFFTEDFEELRQAGYLLSAVPQQFGGRGLSLAEVCQEQRRLAHRSAPTALAINMHLYWTGVAADLYRAGDSSLQWLLEEAAAGEIFAAGHGEAGNDLPLLLQRPGRSHRGRVPLHRSKDVRQPEPGLDPLRHPRHGSG
jgi:alkylation response protein AidB-like acyl-CoA dehydrogenase